MQTTWCSSTFTTGDDPEMVACAAAARTLFDRIYGYWKSAGAAGQVLYRHAQEQAAGMGWVLNLDIKGHRVSDFPHAIYEAATWAISTPRPAPACGSWKSRSPIRNAPSVRFTKTCSSRANLVAQMGVVDAGNRSQRPVRAAGAAAANR
jgi:hypothetical protein